MQTTDDAPPWLSDLRYEIERLIARLTPADGAANPQPLSALSPALIERFGSAPAYRPIYEKVLSGELPQVFRSRNRWYWWPRDLDSIGATLGISRADSAAA